VRSFLPWLYALTGATSLAYQLVWSRTLALAFGGTLLTTSAVVSCFLAGLAIGSVLFGSIADRVRSPLRLYALLEALVALYAALSPTLGHHLRLRVSSEVSTLEVIALTALFLLPPTILMGGTFPALLATARSSHARPAALLYGANTTGAVLGVLVTAFALLPLFGLTRTVLVGASVNLLVALVAAVLPPVVGGPDRPSARTGSPAALAGHAPIAFLALALSGAAALVGEIAWTRSLSLILGSSVYAFALVLASFLLGIGLGSLHYARRGRQGEPLDDMVHYEIRAAAAAGLFALLLPVAPAALIPILRAGGGHPLPMAAGAFLVSFVITSYATTALGAAFPAGIAAVQGASATGRAAGLAYAANTLGAIAGALLAAIVLIPRLGLPVTLGLGVVLNLAAAVAAARGRRGTAVRSLAAALVALLVIPAWWRLNQEALVSGVYAYAYRYAAVPGDEAAPSAAPRGSPRPRPALSTPGLVSLQDGTHANVAVYRDERGELSLLIDGKADASTGLDGDMRTQLLLGHLPALFHRGPLERALVIGLGSGVTASALLHYPVARIDVVELEPAVAVAARRWFSAANSGVLDDPRVQLRIGDGRNWVSRRENRYDILTSEPSNLWMSGVASLFTAEFFEEAARALRPGGILCQWMHLYQVSPSDVAIVLRGMQASFPYRAVLVDGPDLLLLASRTPLPTLGEVRFPPVVAADLARVGLHREESLVPLWLGNGDVLDRFAGSGRFHTDDAPVLEFTAPLSIARDRSREIVTALRAAAATVAP
jgi:spermidine synthase